MLKEERYDMILELLEKEKYMTAQVLSKKLFVSLPTIRRDLTELQKRNLIARSHGGAKKLNTEHIVMPINYRKTVNFKEKGQLCIAASKLINDGEIIFIDASTTTLQLAELLSKKGSLTVVTNSILLSTILTKKGIRCYCTGGELQQNSMCYAGEFAERFVSSFNFDKVFFSSHGVNDKGFIVDTSLPETILRQAIIRQSSKSVFLCDASKFTVTASFNLCKLDEISCIISNFEELSSFVPKGFSGEIILA